MAYAHPLLHWVHQYVPLDSFLEVLRLKMSTNHFMLGCPKSSVWDPRCHSSPSLLFQLTPAHSQAGKCCSFPPHSAIFQSRQEHRFPFSAFFSSCPRRGEGNVGSPTGSPLSGKLLGEAERGSPCSCQDWKIMQWGGNEQHAPACEWGSLMGLGLMGGYVQHLECLTDAVGGPIMKLICVIPNWDQRWWWWGMSGVESIHEIFFHVYPFTCFTDFLTVYVSLDWCCF